RLAACFSLSRLAYLSAGAGVVCSIANAPERV
ncbi:MAG: hypothetical protein ACI90S_001145, partial [Marinobacter psychrophilus]